MPFISPDICKCSKSNFMRISAVIHCFVSHLAAKPRISSVRSHRKVNFLFAGLTFLIIAGALIGLCKLFLFQSSPCNFANGPTEYQLMQCLKYQSGIECSFSTLHCSNNCPVGFESNEYGCPVSCSCAIVGVFESDISFNPNTLASILSDYVSEEDSSATFASLQTVSNQHNLWKNLVFGIRAKIPFVLSRNIYNDKKARRALQAMFITLSVQTCVDFFPRSNEKSFVEFVISKKICSSSIGRIGGRQQVNIGSSCLGNGSISHQFMHVLGFWHEHTRYDRNDHVVILHQHIKPGFAHNFRQRGYRSSSHHDFPYDFQSITHFDGLDYSSNDQPTIIKKRSRKNVVAQRFWLSKIDLAKINDLYCQNANSRTLQRSCISCVDPQTGDVWSDWSVWSVCSSSCGPGQANSVRVCKDVDGNIVYHGRCKGVHYKTRLCENASCQQDLWGPWSPCSVTCGAGRMFRESCCGNKAEYEEKTCNKKSCKHAASVGVWTTWESWNECSEECAAGVQQRYRRCVDESNSTLPRSECLQELPGIVEFRKCPKRFCTINGRELGSWGLWSKWSGCSLTCGSGSLSRSRLCLKLDLKILNVSAKCIEKYSDQNLEVQLVDCSLQPCKLPDPDVPIQRKKKTVGRFANITEAKWREWSSWGFCSKTCNRGKRYRTRTCSGLSSNACLGPSHEAHFCNDFSCDSIPDTHWTPWTEWSDCSSWCHGTRWRKRLFQCGSPSKCGNLPYIDVTSCNAECEGPPSNSSYVKAVKKKANWAGWSTWSDCTKPCDAGVKWRRRECIFGKPGSEGCMGSAYSIESCNDITCSSLYHLWASWGGWSVCSANCFGTRLRSRSYTCIPKNKCESAPSIDIEPCNTECADEAEGISTLDEESIAMGYEPKWSDWSAWVRCTKRCGGGIEWRKRDCLFGNVGHDGCQSNAYETKPCNTHVCLPIWNQTTVFCEHFLQVVDYNGDGFADLVCVYDQNIATTAKPLALNKMKVAINMKDGTFDVKNVEFEAVLHEVQCGNQTAHEGPNNLKAQSNLKKIQPSQFSNDPASNATGFNFPNHLELPVRRRANKGFCYGNTNKPSREMISVSGDHLHVLCFNENGRLERVFLNASSVDVSV